MSYAPIVLFVYNRPDHTRKTVEALLKNAEAKESDFFIFADGPKKAGDEKVTAVRDYIKTVSGFKNVTLRLSDVNRGLATSVIAGVTEIVEKYGRIIVLEDDLITAPYFLKYMNDALDRYENEKKVFSITGYSYFPKGSKKLPETYFLQNMSSWTWATWADRWALFDPECKGWKEKLSDRKVVEQFDHGKCFNLTKMMWAQMEYKTINSWAVRWCYCAFLNAGLGLFPNTSLVQNTGADGTGTHSGNDSKLSKNRINNAPITYFPDKIEEPLIVSKEINRLYRAKHCQHYVKRGLHYITHIWDIPKKIIKR